MKRVMSIILAMVVVLTGCCGVADQKDKQVNTDLQESKPVSVIAGIIDANEKFYSATFTKVVQKIL